MQTRPAFLFRRSGSAACILLAVLLLPLLSAPLPAQTPPTVTKLLGRAITPQAGNEFGNAVAVSDSFLLVGEPNNDDKGTDAGAAHLYDARTGKYLRKLTAKDAAAGDEFGTSVALSGNLALVGAYWDDDGKGAVYLFDARSGAPIRTGHDVPGKLTASDGAAFDRFGFSVALSGNLALIGAWGNDDGKGAAYLFDARSGIPLATGHDVPGKLIATDGAVGDWFGISVALSGNLALIGAYLDDSHKGAAYVFDARTGGAHLHKLTASDGMAGDVFGVVALSGNLALIGAPRDDSDKGAAYLFDARSGIPLATGHIVPGKLIATDGAVGDRFGGSVALSGNLALIGAGFDDSDKGAAYVFNARSGIPLATGHVVPGKLIATDGAVGDRFGFNVALSGNLALAGAWGDNDNGDSSGSAYFIRPLAAPLPLARVATRGALAPGSADATFSTFPQAFINSDGASVLQATLSGPGSRGGRNRGVWHNLSGDLDLALRFKDTDLGDGRRATKIHNAWGLAAGSALIQATVAGPGVNSGNNQAVYHDNAASLLQIVRTGEDPGGHLGGALPQSFPQIAQQGGEVTVFNTRLKKAGGVTADNDSALFFVNQFTGVPTGTVFREGVTGVDGGGTLGQIVPRVARSRSSNAFGFGAALIPAGGGTARQAVFANAFSNATAVAKAVQGGNAPDLGIPPAQFRSFLGESVSANNGSLAWRASLGSGPGVTRKNNEGLWHGWSDFLIARKGQEVDPAGLPGVKIARFLQFWPALDMPGFDLVQALVLVKLSGPKVSGGNDLALCLWEESAPDALQILLREGQFVEGADGPAIRVIQRVDVDPLFGHYTVLCSLTGAAERNQALFTGHSTLVSVGALKALRQPRMKLRKGILYTLPGTTTTARLRSLSLPVVVDKTGAGGKGLGQVINSDGKMVLTLDFDNKAREVLSGVP